MRWSMNQAVRWVTLSARPSSWEEMEFLLLAINQTAGSHLSQPRGESSKIVPTLALNCLRHFGFLHFQMRRVARNPVSRERQRGHTGTPSGHLRLATKARATSGSEK